MTNFNDFFVNVKYILFLGVTFVITSNSHSQCLEGDCENGVGTKKYENGSVYEGEFVSGLKKYGKNTYPSGTIYEGSFLNNQRHGTGKFTYSNGDVFQGQYVEDNKVYGLYSYANGNSYYGEYDDNKPNGFGTFTFNNGSVIEGFWIDGKQDFSVESDSIVIDTNTLTENLTEEIIDRNAKHTNPRIFAVIVGVSDYYSDNMDLNYCDDDAKIFYNHLISAFPSETSNGEVSLILDTKATHTNIANELSRVFSKSTESDFIIFYFSGHGGEGVFCPTDSYNYLYHSEVKNAFKKAEAKYRLCIADACYSGSLGETTGTPTYSDVENLRDARLAVILSSTDSQTSSETSVFGQGVFSYFLMQGLKGMANINNDRYVTAGELFMYTREAVSRYTNKKQIPIIVGQQLHKIPLCKLK
mgnify:CR=1 FL=1